MHVNPIYLIHLQDEDEEDVEVLEHVSGVVTSVLKHFGDQGMMVVDQLMPQLGKLMTPGASPQETRVCICIIDDILEYSAAGEHYYHCCPKDVNT